MNRAAKSLKFLIYASVISGKNLLGGVGHAKVPINVIGELGEALFDHNLCLILDINLMNCFYASHISHHLGLDVLG